MDRFQEMKRIAEDMVYLASLHAANQKDNQDLCALTAKAVEAMRVRPLGFDELYIAVDSATFALKLSKDKANVADEVNAALMAFTLLYA